MDGFLGYNNMPIAPSPNGSTVPHERCHICNKKSHSVQDCWWKDQAGNDDERPAKRLRRRGGRAGRGRGRGGRVDRVNSGSRDGTKDKESKVIEDEERKVDKDDKDDRGNEKPGSPPPADEDLYVKGELSGSALLNRGETKRDGWLVAPLASRHMTWNRALFSTFQPCEDVILTLFTNLAPLKVKGVGDIRISFVAEHGGADNVTIRNVLYVPRVPINIISIEDLIRKGLGVWSFDKRGEVICMAIDKNGRRVGTAPMTPEGFILEPTEQQEIFY